MGGWRWTSTAEALRILQQLSRAQVGASGNARVRPGRAGGQGRQRAGLAWRHQQYTQTSCHALRLLGACLTVAWCLPLSSSVSPQFALPCSSHHLQVSLVLLESTGICRAVAQLRTHSNRDVAVRGAGGGSAAAQVGWRQSGCPLAGMLSPLRQHPPLSRHPPLAPCPAHRPRPRASCGAGARALSPHWSRRLPVWRGACDSSRGGAMTLHRQQHSAFSL